MKSKFAYLFNILSIIGFINFSYYLCAKDIFSPLLVLLFIIILYLKIKNKKIFFSSFNYYLSGIFISFLKFNSLSLADYFYKVRTIFLFSTLFFIIHLIIKSKALLKLSLKLKNYSPKKRLLFLFILFQLIFIVSSIILYKQGLVLVGDEPYYMAISRSISQDGDINLFNEQIRGEFKDYVLRERLPGHANFGKGVNKLYSIHLPGLSFLIAPLLKLKIPVILIYLLIRIYISMFASVSSLILFLTGFQLSKRFTLTLFATLTYTLSVPIFFMSMHIFPEIQASFFILLGLYLFIYKESLLYKLISAISLTIPAFFGVKYLIFSFIYLPLFTLHLIKKKKIKQAVIFLLVGILIIGLFYGFIYKCYGNFSPVSVYKGRMNKAQKADYYKMVFNMPLSKRIDTLLGQFFDQRDGLIPYNPFYLFSISGLFLLLIKYKKYINLILLSLPPLAYIAYHAFSTFRAGQCPQGRFFAPVAWFLMLLSIIYYTNCKNRFIKRIFLNLPLLSFVIIALQLSAPYTLYQSSTHEFTTRASWFFTRFSTLNFRIYKFLPTFLSGGRNNFNTINIIFLSFIFILVALTIIFINKKSSFKIKKILPTVFILILLPFFLSPSFPINKGGLKIKENLYIFGLNINELNFIKKGEIPLIKNGYKILGITSKNRIRNIELTINNHTEDKISFSLLNYAKDINISPNKSKIYLLKDIKALRYKGYFLYSFYIKPKNINCGLPPFASIDIKINQNSNNYHK